MSFDEVSSSESMELAHCEHEHGARVLLMQRSSLKGKGLYFLDLKHQLYLPTWSS